MNNEYKYWLYYLKNEDSYDLYAYTDKKEISSKFDDFRDMNLFIKKKKKLSKLEVNELAKNEQSKYLIIYKINVYDKIRARSFIIETALTIGESMTISNIVYNIETGMILTKNSWFDYRLFNNEILKSLNVIRYVDLYDYITNKENEESINYIKADELGIFLRYYGKTLKSEE